MFIGNLNAAHCESCILSVSEMCVRARARVYLLSYFPLRTLVEQSRSFFVWFHSMEITGMLYILPTVVLQVEAYLYIENINKTILSFTYAVWFMYTSGSMVSSHLDYKAPRCPKLTFLSLRENHIGFTLNLLVWLICKLDTWMVIQVIGSHFVRNKYKISIETITVFSNILIKRELIRIELILKVEKCYVFNAALVIWVQLSLSLAVLQNKTVTCTGKQKKKGHNFLFGNFNEL